ncbi:MAG: hypothetical protein KDN22_31675 [Verrucomicrobiae bacterium]|nr:hypothetical protein [Verrucomicrobiae bacterium]
MNTSDLEEIWNQPQTSSLPNAEEALQTFRREQSKVKRRKFCMTMCGFNLALASTLGAWALASGKSAILESWPALVSLIALWATYIEFVLFRRRQSHRFGQQDIRSVLQVSLRRALASLREIKILLAVNLLTIVPMTLTSVQMLISSDKMTTREALSFGVFGFVVFGLNIAFLAVYGIAKIRPQCHLLRDRLDALDS